jgi:aminoglycoside 6'-N-acetyltransferase
VTLTFQPLRREDFPLLAHWLAEPLVHRWWNDESTLEAVERDYGPCVDGTEPAEVFVAHVDGRPVGLVQRYEISAYPEDGAELLALCPGTPGAFSVDYLIGDAAARGSGLAARMIAEFVELSWARHPDAAEVVVPVAAGNRASWRSLERAGFTRIAEGELTPDNPVDPRDHVVYRLARPR